MTILKRHRDLFKELTQILTVDAKLSSTCLNKKAPSSYYDFSGSHQTKGVESDHIKIFRLNPTKTFALAFYFDKGHLATIKENDSVMASNKYDDEAFILKVKDFMNKLKLLKATNNLDVSSIEAAVKKIFIENNQFDEAKETKSVEKAIADKISKIGNDFPKEMGNLHALHRKMGQDKTSLLKKRIELTKELGIKELEGKLEKAKSTLERRLEKYKQELKIEETTIAIQNSKESFKDYENKVSSIIKEEIKHLPKNLKEEVLSKNMKKYIFTN